MKPLVLRSHHTFCDSRQGSERKCSFDVILSYSILLIFSFEHNTIMHTRKCAGSTANYHQIPAAHLSFTLLLFLVVQPIVVEFFFSSQPSNPRWLRQDSNPATSQRHHFPRCPAMPSSEASWQQRPRPPGVVAPRPCWGWSLGSYEETGRFVRSLASAVNVAYGEMKKYEEITDKQKISAIYLIYSSVYRSSLVISVRIKPLNIT